MQQGLLIGFLKKIIFRGEADHFRAKNGMPSSLLIFGKDFFEILLTERDQEVHGKCINGFCEKIPI